MLFRHLLAAIIIFLFPAKTKYTEENKNTALSQVVVDIVINRDTMSRYMKESPVLEKGENSPIEILRCH